MSSAILYLAIIAIWACVLIPRWLKRGSVSPVAAPASDSAGLAVSLDADEPYGAEADAAPAAEPLSAGPPAAGPAPAEESRRRMLAARRRLLLMLAGLEAAAAVLALTGLAAVWVVIPPTVMLAGYLLLLREAAKADAERTAHQADATAREGGQAAARSPAAQPATPAEGTSTAGTSAAGVAAAAEALAAKLAAAPVPADYEDSGRDFAPGLAGKYTTSNADADVADEDYYASYEPPRLRAVGD